jgi:SAM-dependent methyltransferase
MFDRFEAIYRDADGSVERIPWAHAKPCPWALAWAQDAGRALLRPGAPVAVAGCGLGNDVAAMRRLGFEAIGLDVCPSAIAGARQRFPEHAASFQLADLMDLPSSLRDRFELVVEVHTLQSLPPACRPALAVGIASLLRPGGLVLAIARGRADERPLDELDGPPFPFTAKELSDVFGAAGLREREPVRAFHAPADRPVHRLQGVWERPA